MRKIKAIATYMAVVGFLLVGMSHFAFASDLFVQPDTFQFKSVSSSADSYIIPSSFGQAFSNNWSSVEVFIYADNVGSHAQFSIAREGFGAFCATTLTSYPLIQGWNDVVFTFPSGGCTTQTYSNDWTLYNMSVTIGIYDGSGGYAYNGIYPFLSVVDSGGGTVYPVPSDINRTRFISLQPSGVVSTTTTIGYDFYLNSADYRSGEKIDMYFEQDSASACANSGAVYDAVATCAGLNAPASSFTLHIDPSTLLSGDNVYSTTTTFLGGGAWTMTATQKIPGLFGLWYSNGIASSTHFIIGTSSPMDIVRGVIASTTRPNAFTGILASSTAAIGSACNPLSFSFSAGDCLEDLVFPPSWSDTFVIIRNTPPWGYVFRFYDIVTGTASSSLPVLSATIPASLPGGGAHISLDLNHSLDMVLNATSGPFISVEASSSQTLYQITSPYWDILCYLGLGLYILGRIIPLFYKLK